MPSISQTLEARLQASEGKPVFLGELVLLPSPAGWELRHRVDADAAGKSLRRLADLPAIREIGKADASGTYRPLRVARGLRNGWRTHPLVLPALVEALHALYPSALPFWAHPRPPVPFSETARRQTGMYRLVQTCGDEGEPLRAAIAGTCEAVCLRRRQWGPGTPAPETAPDAIPLPCPEACNYLIAKVREEIVAAGKKA
ncbi:sirohydrochlorin cobaltochelatase [Verrucomicrobium sp. GAS474]|uniref:DR2241 family protein n=1 Tax=Verrucomicrobium sp. GAS474 TaxID=1882831 RepID=UPI00087D51DD|nr:DR2241 family protein [Verrucomicrobium sp. GAS474]SDU01782.1 sirohydrochlorin cobaltochelatase [Verrucomicrobium sp. GAS474]